MPWFIAALLGGLRYAAGSIFVQALIGIGVGVATYTGTDITMDWAKSQAVANFQSLPPDLLGVLAYLKIGKAINIVFSAMLMRLSMTAVRNAAGALAIKRFFKL